MVLAGGRSTRFGADDKLGATFTGMPLLHHPVLRLAEITGDVVVVLAPDATEPTMPPGTPVRYARDAQEDEGPLAGAVAGLGAVDRQLAVLAGGDMPSLSTAVILEMLRVAGTAPVDAVALQDGDRFRPLPVVVRVAPARELGHALLHDGERSLRGWLRAMRVAVIDEATWTALDPGRETLRDVDEPTGLDEAADLTPGEDHVMSHVVPMSIGSFDVSVVCQGFAPLDLAEECPGHEVDWPAERERHPWAFHDERSWPWHVHAFVVRGPDGLAMVDTGLGAYPPYRPWAGGSGVTAEEAYASSGVDVAEVGVVVLTHLHADHAGGSWAGGEPRFPNARYVLHEADLEFFTASPDPDGYAAVAELRRIEELGMLEGDPTDREVMPGLRLVHTPGHTPGHRSVILDAGPEHVLLTGDLLHLPMQAAHPSWLSSHDEDPETGAASRTAMIARAASGGWYVGVPHLARPFGHVDDDGWRSTDLEGDERPKGP